MRECGIRGDAIACTEEAVRHEGTVDEANSDVLSQSSHGDQVRGQVAGAIAALTVCATGHVPNAWSPARSLGEQGLAFAGVDALTTNVEKRG